MRLSMIPPALVAALVGYGSTVALLLTAAAAVGASGAETASWLLMISLGKALGSAGLSLWSRVPVVLAWSTPGAALIAATTGVTMPQAVGAFVAAGLMVAATGLITPLGRLVARIPDAVAQAMLAGVLLPFCVKIALSAQDLPAIVLPMIAVFVLVRLANPALAVLAALATGLALTFVLGAAGPIALPQTLAAALPPPVLIWPEFRADVVLGLGLPLYLVTMASQNLPGFAILRGAGYDPPVRAALIGTGGISAVIGLFGAHTISMAAITAAICLTPDTHPDKSQRWRVGLVYGAIWLGLGLASPLILAVLTALPPGLMAALVALALLSPLMGALAGAFTPAETRFAAVVTLVVSASGLVLAGVGAAFWGLAAGLVVVMVETRSKRST